MFSIDTSLQLSVEYGKFYININLRTIGCYCTNTTFLGRTVDARLPLVDMSVSLII